MRKFYAFFLLMLMSAIGISQTAGDYRTNDNGFSDWSSAIWDRFDGSNWVSGQNGPSTVSSSNTVTILAGGAVTIGGSVTNNGTIVVNDQLYVLGGTLINAGTITNNGTFEVFTGTYRHNRNGGVLPANGTYDAGSFLEIMGVTNAAPTNFPSNLGNLTINCSGLTTTIDIPEGVNISDDLTVTNTGSGSVNFVAGTGNVQVSGNLTIGASGKAIVESGAALTVDGTFSNSSGTNGFIIKSGASSTGSFINSSNGINATVERYISGNKWHLVGAGTSGSTSNNFNGCFLQYYTESDNVWTYITTTSYNLAEGTGYSVWSNSSATYNFTGGLYASDKSFSNLSWGGDVNHGFHILSNPFPCAIGWNSGSWGINNISGTAKIYNGSNYVDLPAGGDIPPQNGFVIQATDGTNSITIPADSKKHAETNFYKADNDQVMISLNVTDNLNKTNDFVFVRFYEDATFDFEHEYDAYKLKSGITAGQMYYKVNNEDISTLGVPFFNDNRSFSLNFEKGEATNYTLSVDEMHLGSAEAILEDVIENEFIPLNENTSYSFVATDADQNERFILHLNGVTGNDEIENNTEIQIWSSHHSIYLENTSAQSLNSLDIIDMQGKIVANYILTDSRIQRFDLSLKSGIYMIRVKANTGIFTKKVLL